MSAMSKSIQINEFSLSKIVKKTLRMISYRPNEGQSGAKFRKWLMIKNIGPVLCTERFFTTKREIDNL